MINKGRVDNFCPIVPKSWDIMIRADRVNSRQYLLLGSMDPENIIKENNNFPLFFFEYFAQKDISGLIDETLELKLNYKTRQLNYSQYTSTKNFVF